MRCKNSNSENIKKKMTDVYDPDFWQTFLDYTIRSTKMRKNTALFKVWELLVSEIVCLFFFLGWMNFNPFKIFLNRSPPQKKNPAKWGYNSIFFGKGKTIYILGTETHYLNQNWNFKAKVIHLYLLAEEACEQANIPECVCIEKFHMQDRHPKWLNIIYFFF